MRVFLVLSAVLIAGPIVGAAERDPAALAAKIDRNIAAKLKERRVKPAPRADDATYFRRIHLAIVGRIPLPTEVRDFLADRDPTKRRKAVDRLLASPGYVNNFTTLWRGWMLPEATTNFEIAYLAGGFEAWLRARIHDNTPYNQLVTELITVPVGGATSPYVSPGGNRPAPTPVAFYQAKEAKPENLAAATSRLFLGIQIECAQCHNHPFARWSRDQFWGLASFFGGIERVGQPNIYSPMREILDRRELLIPNTDRVVQAAFLDDREPEWKSKTSARVALAEWVTSADNPFFARAGVNRMWWYFFGVGIVDPVDDFNEDNQPSHPELLDELAKEFAASGFDMKYLIRAICASEAYQRGSAATDPSQYDPRLFARFPVQGLSSEQLYDSLAVAIMSGGEQPGSGYLRNPGAPRRQFLEAFALGGRKTDAEATILQALTLMNGDLVSRATQVGSSRTLAAVVELPGLSPKQRVEALYLAALSRPPQPDELRRALRHIHSGKHKNDHRRYADVLWALLNGVEFRTNH
jgi:hypothetical protein